ncbi:MAG TPA: DUF2950 domain-containing protein [Candidatus Acidoferrum sp.]|nr:DUF2950 domain-containing protein [Candidatus Acidoferrum sp.]
MRNRLEGKSTLSNARGRKINYERQFAFLGKFAGCFVLIALMFAASASFGAARTPQDSQQATYSSPDDALQALVSAAKDRDRSALPKLFGPDYTQLLSGDQVEDDKDLSDFATAVEESAKLKKDSDTKYTVIVGNDNWPAPIPIVQKDGKWMFDTKAGLEEVLNRRIGENELSAIQTCRAYAIAQWEYYTEGDWDHDGVAVYALRFISTSGKHDGLFWETGEDEKPSPLGKLVAQARAEGYEPEGNATAGTAKTAASEEAATLQHEPYHGYHFKILVSQGPHAPGGKYGYIINENMIAGYALVAYPDSWGKSGVMTFIINQQGRVYEKNLGANSAKIAATMTSYDPDPSWKFVPNEP